LSPGLVKMYISFIGMGSMILSLIAIYFSRYKFTGFLKIATAVLAYMLMILAGIIMILVVFSGPTNE